MQTADYNYEDFDQSRQNELDKSLYVKFEYKNRPDKEKSEQQGMEVLKPVLYISIRPAGGEEVSRPARQTDLERFPLHYNAFKNRVAPPESGTPLAKMPYMEGKDRLIEQLSFKGIKTVEQLAAMPDTAAAEIMGGQTFKQEAITHMEYMKEAKEYSDKKKLAEENEKLKEQNAQQAQQLADLTKRLDALEGKDVDPEIEEKAEKLTNEFKCECGKICKSENGLKVHKRACKK